MTTRDVPGGPNSSPLTAATPLAYDWLLFDADGTLFDYDRAEATALRRTFERSGLAFVSEYLEAYRGFNQAVWRALEQGQLTPNVLKVRRFELLLASLKLDCAPAPFSELYLECLGECGDLIEGALEMFHALDGKYRAAILTNGLQAVQRSRLARSPIRDYIAELVISEEIGCAKPAKAYFDAALARLGNPDRRRVLMVGDNWGSDIQGAADSGIDTCWFNPQGHARPSSLAITREVASLRELTDWLQPRPQSP